MKRVRDKTKNSSSKMPKAKSKATSKKTKRESLPVELCQNCSKDLTGDQRALFVEEEIGRIFCSETCIARYFTPEIRHLEQEYIDQMSPRDLSGDERESYSYLRWEVLQSPEEVWMQPMEGGDRQYTLISKFPGGPQNDNKPIWCICISLFLRGEPSFLFIAFPTRLKSLVDFYRRGTQLEITTRQRIPELDEPTDQLGTEWSEEETRQAELIQARKSNDIPPEQFDEYARYFEETLESPDEVWTVGVRDLSDVEDQRLYHFVRYYPNEINGHGQEPHGMWYVIVAKDTGEDEEIEILDSFPTQDELLVHRYRTGRRELERERDQPSRRVLN